MILGFRGRGGALFEAAAIFFALSFFACADTTEFKELKGDHFIVYYQGSEAQAADVLRKAEGYYRQIADDLGYVRYGNFWQWDKRVKIYFYPGRQEFLASTNQPSWSAGRADYTAKEIFGFAGSSEFLIGVLPHEIAHLVFRDFVGFVGEIPLWLDEGVAQWVERAKRAVVRAATRDLYERKQLLTLQELTRTDIRYSGDGEKAKNFYIQAASLVEFLISHYGAARFTEFCRRLRDGRSLEEGLRLAYPAQVSGFDELEKKWLEYITGFRVAIERVVENRREIVTYE